MNYRQSRQSRLLFETSVVYCYFPLNVILYIYFSSHRCYFTPLHSKLATIFCFVLEYKWNAYNFTALSIFYLTVYASITPGKPSFSNT